MQNVDDRLERRSRSYRSDREMPVEMMMDVVNEARAKYDTVSILAREKVSIECMPAGVDSVTVVFRDEQFPDEVRERVFAEVEAELHPDHMSYTRGIAFLVAVGEGMRTTVGTCLHVVTALSRAGVNLQMINQGSSELSIMFGIREVDMKPAVQALYREFFGS